jgi:hypothetical protein
LNLGAAARGANSDITSITGLATALAVNQGGTGASTVSAARFNLAAAASGNNSDITSINGLITPLSTGQGGTGFSNYTIGDMLYAVGATTLGKLSDVATGNALLSGGVGTPPSWGKIGLATHVSGTLQVANGGTGATTPSGARTNLGVAASGANSDITSLSGLLTSLSVSQGGTGSSVQNFVDLTTVQTANGNKTFGGNTTFQGTVTVGTGVNPGAPIFDVWSATAPLGFPPTAPGTNSDMVVVVNGAQLGDVVMLGVPNGSVLPNSAYTAWVSAINQVTVRFNNYSAGILAPAMGMFRVAVMRF